MKKEELQVLSKNPELLYRMNPKKITLEILEQIFSLFDNDYSLLLFIQKIPKKIKRNQELFEKVCLETENKQLSSQWILCMFDYSYIKFDTDDILEKLLKYSIYLVKYSNIYKSKKFLDYIFSSKTNFEKIILKNIYNSNYPQEILNYYLNQYNHTEKIALINKRFLFLADPKITLLTLKKDITLFNKFLEITSDFNDQKSNNKELFQMLSPDNYQIPIRDFSKAKFFFQNYYYHKKRILSLINKSYNIDMSIAEFDNLINSYSSSILTRFLYVYSITKKVLNRVTINEIIANSVITEAITSYGGIIHELEEGNELFEKKYQNILRKTRLKYLPSFFTINKMSEEISKKFNLKTYLSLIKVISDDYLIGTINLFGLFESDNNAPKRIKFCIDLFSQNNSQKYYFTVLKNDPTKRVFERLEGINSSKDYIYVLNKDLDIPEEFKHFLKFEMSKSQYQRIKKLTGSYGKKINDFLSPYAYQNGTYVLKRNVNVPFDYNLEQQYSEEEYNDLLTNPKMCAFLSPYIKKPAITYFPKSNVTSEEMNEIIRQTEFYVKSIYKCPEFLKLIDNALNSYNEEFIDFVVENIDFFLEDKFYRINQMYSDFNAIKKSYYKNNGKSKVSYYYAISYIESISIENYDPGYLDFMANLKLAGIDEEYEQYSEDEDDYLEEENVKEIILWYRNLYDKSRQRKLSTIPKVEFLATTNNKKYLVEILSFDNPLNVTTGEKNFMNNCYSQHGCGESCLIHSCISKSGRNLCVYEYTEKGLVLLIQSWLWRDGNTLCLDNIESSNNYKSEDYFNIKEILTFLSQEIIKITSTSAQPITNVVLGTGCDDSEIIELFEKAHANITPRDYEVTYNDSFEKVHIYGDEDYQSYEVEAEYRDPRKIEISKGIDSKKADKLYRIIEEDEWLDKNIVKLEKSHMITGSDFYILFNQEKQIKILNIMKNKARFKDEQVNQVLELMYAFDKVLELSVKEGKSISCELTSQRIKKFYDLYLKKGYIEEIKSNNNQVEFKVGANTIKHINARIRKQ